MGNGAAISIYSLAPEDRGRKLADLMTAEELCRLAFAMSLAMNRRRRTPKDERSGALKGSISFLPVELGGTVSERRVRQILAAGLAGAGLGEPFARVVGPWDIDPDIGRVLGILLDPRLDFDGGKLTREIVEILSGLQEVLEDVVRLRSTFLHRSLHAVFGPWYQMAALLSRGIESRRTGKPPTPNYEELCGSPVLDSALERLGRLLHYLTRAINEKRPLSFQAPAEATGHSGDSPPPELAAAESKVESGIVHVVLVGNAYEPGNKASVIVVLGEPEPNDEELYPYWDGEPSTRIHEIVGPIEHGDADKAQHQLGELLARLGFEVRFKTVCDD